eukprot:TRINITY_DN965_c0_g1_i1.p1 TRINITY_DN965_c0_g1~~TRINITY_DN965_c0_g1_i1.p1  ORF type:complete len:126 (-),score=26.61 TRINITY_DN965_c0_g1_i1:42-419(-)
MDPESFELPTTLVSKIVKGVLPEGTIITKEAKLALTLAAKVFILYLTACSNDFCRSCSRTTVGANHVLGALDELEFVGMRQQLETLLSEHKQDQQEKKETRTKKQDRKTTKDKVDQGDLPSSYGF